MTTGKRCTHPGCSRPHYAKGLCRGHYESFRKRSIRARKKAQSEGQLLPQGVAASRTRGEVRDIQYDPRRHPGILHRCLLIGQGVPMVADIIGVSEETLQHWIHSKEKMREAARTEQEMDGHIAKAAINLALGRMDPATGEYRGGNAAMLKFLLETRLGFRAPKEPKAPADDGSKMLTPEGKDQIASLLKTLNRITGHSAFPNTLEGEVVDQRASETKEEEPAPPVSEPPPVEEDLPEPPPPRATARAVEETPPGPLPEEPAAARPAKRRSVIPRDGSRA